MRLGKRKTERGKMKMGKIDYSKLEHKQLRKDGGKYFVEIDISVDEWKQMIQDESIFYKEALEMILSWYQEEDYQSTSKAMMMKYYPEYKGTPYNGVVKQLSIRIIKYLNRFWVECVDTPGTPSYWCIPFNGWHGKTAFVWALRPELVTAINILVEERKKEIINVIDYLKKKLGNEKPILEYHSELTSRVICSEKEGKKIGYYTTKYERSSKNRQAKIYEFKLKNKRLFCEVCGFDFEKIYGERGKDFIEVHHNKPLFSLEAEIELNPAMDLNCVCSNCHRMIHRRAEILSVKELRSIIKNNK